MSVIAPSSIPACIPAPNATASSGFTVARGLTPVTASTNLLIHGMRVAPPTITTSSSGLPCGNSLIFSPGFILRTAA
eukprot:35103-Eustigmatos_ZCMA.PRE.1